MDNINILELIYIAIRDIKSAKSTIEYGDIVIDIEKINVALKFGYINESINVFTNTKSMQEVYNELLNKYEGKIDWGYSGYYAYH